MSKKGRQSLQERKWGVTLQNWTMVVTKKVWTGLCLDYFRPWLLPHALQYSKELSATNS